MSYGFGIVGIGMISAFHAKAIGAMDNGRLVACFSRSEEKAKRFAKEYGCRGYSDFKAFLSDSELDIVTICTPSGAHVDYALAAAEAGKHAIVEKPLEITLSRCDKIIDAYAKKGLQLGGVFQSRFYEASRILKEAVSGNRFGKLVLGDAYIKWFRSQEYYDKGGWKGTKALDGGGALMNQSIHAIDLLQWYMGKVSSVSAFSGILGHERIEVEDTAVAALQFENGALGVIEGTTAIYPGFLKRIEISGTRGSAVLEEDHFNVWSFADEGEKDRRVREELGKKEEAKGGASDPSAIDFTGHRMQFENFVNALDEREGLVVDGIEARKSVEIILAIYESASKGKRIKLR